MDKNILTLYLYSRHCSIEIAYKSILNVNDVCLGQTNSGSAFVMLHLRCISFRRFCIIKSHFAHIKLVYGGMSPAILCLGNGHLC